MPEQTAKPPQCKPPWEIGLLRLLAAGCFLIAGMFALSPLWALLLWTPMDGGAVAWCVPWAIGGFALRIVAGFWLTLERRTPPREP